MKVKEITIGRGRKYTADYKSINYHVGITIESEGDDLVEDMIVEANNRVVDMESGEDIRCRLIIEQIKAEQIEGFKKTYNNVTKKIEKGEQFTKEVLEEVIMDLTEVTVMVMTEKAMLVTKKGFQKWLPFSVIDGGNSNINEGDFLTDIVLTEKGSKWIPNKSWDKLEVAKRG